MRTEILYNRDLGGGNFLMGLRDPEGARALPGQFVMVKVVEEFDPLLRRPLAVYRVPEPDIVELIYKVVGRGTALLAEKRPGAWVDSLGPLGAGFTLDPPEGKALVVAGGIGIASVVMPSERFPRDKVVSFFGARTEADLVGATDLASASSELFLATDDGSRGHRGFVTEPFEERLRGMDAAERARSRVLCCGPEPMMTRVARLSTEYGVGACELAMERHMGCGVGACLGCVLPRAEGGYMTLCTVGPVVEASRVNWEAMG